MSERSDLESAEPLKPAARSFEILIVDDSSTNNLLFENILESSGYQVHIATNGHDALKYIEQHSPNLILLDIMMGGMDGYDVLRRIVENPKTRNIPVVMVSARKDPESMKLAMKLGARDYLTKPLGIDELIAKVDRFSHVTP
jgi:CheY-like chemotaxis protein